MKPVPFDYERPRTIAECLTLLAKHGEEARVIAGGQSLMPMLALRLARPSVIIDLNWIQELTGIAVQGDILRIGAMTRQAAVRNSPEVAKIAPLLIKTLFNVGHPPTRARGTIGGSLSHADPAAELPVAMTALAATMIVNGPGGERRVPADEFFHGSFQTAIGTGEMLVAIEIPHETGASGFFEVSPRHGDFAIVSAAARLELDDKGVCTSCTLVVGGIDDRPTPCLGAAQRLEGRRIDGTSLRDAMSALPYDAISMDSRMATADYRRQILPIVVRRAIEHALDERKAIL